MEVPASQLAFGYRKTDLIVRFWFSDVLYLDALTKTYVEEFSAANFFGIRDHTFMTPDSPSVLASITNACVRQIAADTGLKVERRPIPVAELPEFDELGALGTAAVITPIGRIVFGDDTYVYGEGSQAGPTPPNSTTGWWPSRRVGPRTSTAGANSSTTLRSKIP